MTFKKDSKDNAFKKPMMELLDPINQLDQAKVLTHGAKKYGLNNWRLARVGELHHYLGAAQRHLNAYARGIGIDNETGLPHLAHLQVNAMFLDWFRRRDTSWATMY